MWVHLELSCKALTWKQSHKSFPLPWLSLLRWYHPFQDRHCTCLTSRLLIKTFLSIASLRVLFANRVHPEKDVPWRLECISLCYYVVEWKKWAQTDWYGPIFLFFNFTTQTWNFWIENEKKSFEWRTNKKSQSAWKTSFLSEAGIVWLKHKFRRWQRREQIEMHLHKF